MQFHQVLCQILPQLRLHLLCGDEVIEFHKLARIWLVRPDSQGALRPDTSAREPHRVQLMHLVLSVFTWGGQVVNQDLCVCFWSNYILLNIMLDRIYIYYILKYFIYAWKYMGSKMEMTNKSIHLRFYCIGKWLVSASILLSITSWGITSFGPECQHRPPPRHTHMKPLKTYYIYIYIFEGSLEVKLPTIWTDEKQSKAEQREEKN